MKVNKKLLQQHLSESTGKVVTLKDITNVQTGLSKPDDSNLESVVNTLRKIEGIVHATSKANDHVTDTWNFHVVQVQQWRCSQMLRAHLLGYFFRIAL